MKKAKFCLRLNEDIYKRIAQEADKLGVTTNAYITMVLIKELSKLDVVK